MYNDIPCPPVRRYSVGLGFSNLESELEEIKNKCEGCELYLSAASRNHLPNLRSFMILSKFLDDVTPAKIIFDSIAVTVTRFVKCFDSTSSIISKLVKISSIEFNKCGIEREVYVNFFAEENHRVVEVIFKDCRIAPNGKFTIISGLAFNYSIRNLVIADADDSNKKSDAHSDAYSIEIHSKINEYLSRNRAHYLCRMATLTIIGLRKHRHTHLNIVDKQITTYLAKMIYATKTNIEWLKTINK
jgi:hypothetical protein